MAREICTEPRSCDQELPPSTEAKIPLSTVPTSTVLLFPSRPMAVTEPWSEYCVPLLTRPVSEASTVNEAPPLTLRFMAGVPPLSWTYSRNGSVGLTAMRAGLLRPPGSGVNVAEPFSGPDRRERVGGFAPT